MGVKHFNGQLELCPFCGKEPIMVQDVRYPRPECIATDAYEVVCKTFGCPIYNADNTYFFSPEEAAAAWNKRRY